MYLNLQGADLVLFRRLKGLMGAKSKEKEYIVSNRCKTCRGYGRRECPQCDGTGRRFSEWL